MPLTSKPKSKTKVSTTLSPSEKAQKQWLKQIDAFIEQVRSFLMNLSSCFAEEMK